MSCTSEAMSEALQQSYKPEKISIPHGHKQNAFCFSLLMNGASEHCSQTRGIQNSHEMLAKRAFPAYCTKKEALMVGLSQKCYQMICHQALFCIRKIFGFLLCPRKLAPKIFKSSFDHRGRKDAIV